MRILLASALCHLYFVIQTESFSGTAGTTSSSSSLQEQAAITSSRASTIRRQQLQQETSNTCLHENGVQRRTTDHIRTTSNNISRRKWIRKSCSKLAFVVAAAASTTSVVAFPQAASAATRASLSSLLYSILRVREATGQETRLIRSGKFKDVQRANVKLAIKFMLENYRLSDSFVGAASYLDDYQSKLQAGQVGQAAVQNLYTILEYFDSSDVQNLKVGSGGGGMGGGKEELVLKGLDAAQKSIDDFLAYFPKSDVDPVRAQIKSENELNVREFDPALGTIVNLPPPS